MRHFNGRSGARLTLLRKAAKHRLYALVHLWFRALGFMVLGPSLGLVNVEAQKQRRRYLSVGKGSLSSADQRQGCHEHVMIREHVPAHVL